MEIKLIEQMPRRPDCVIVLPTSIADASRMARELSIPSLEESAFSPDSTVGARQYINSIAQNIIVSPITESNEEKLKQALHSAIRMLLNGQFPEAVLVTAQLDFRNLLTLVSRVLAEGLYRFDKFKSKAASSYNLQNLSIYTGRTNNPVVQSGLRDQTLINQGISYARDLGNTPPNVCTPQWLASSVQQLGRESQNITVEVLDEIALRTEKMEAMLAVSSGSNNSGTLLVLNYRGLSSSRRPVVLIGKGVTFDSGGISLKPAAKMDEMKFDMAGAAAVIATMKILDMLSVPLNVVALVPCVENMPSGGAYRPGDIINTKSGKSVEVLNTDAEGRLILADAMTFAERYKPIQIIDVATLTGACVVALGRHYTAMYSNNDKLAESMLNAGDESLDPVWRMPLAPEYNSLLKSSCADIANVGGPEAGSVTAACFLQNFVPEKTPWAHLDIAGTAWKSGKDKSSTGRPTALLTQYLLSLGRGM